MIGTLPLRRLGARIAVVCLLVAIAGCAAIAQWRWEKNYGKPSPLPRELTVPLAQYHEPEYYRDIKPIFDKRCVACHGCYDAPCQLKLTSFSGVDRGASPIKVYDGTRLLAENLTRLFIDAQSADEWRQKDFYPVLDEYQQASTSLTGSTLYRMLELKREHPIIGNEPLPPSFDFSLDRDQQCTRVETFDSFARNYPQWGMPYGMPAIEENNFQTIKRWLETGARVIAPPAPDGGVLDEVQRWEKFLNGDSLQQQLMSRYIYEHLYLGDLYFSGDEAHFFKLVRSRTPPSQPPQMIATRRPYDDPGVARVYYRLQLINSTLLVKSHMPYALDDARMEKWRSWFLSQDITVSELPSYEPAVASNPFKAFRELPARS
ncbi:MAG TPA: fatty acid cis/trans isomerase, partial [Spongiibacteraceae bacterium]|nr:fatty acid cis/trans isomerase [Spongiibacteraceae bacterium]